MVRTAYIMHVYSSINIHTHSHTHTHTHTHTGQFPTVQSLVGFPASPTSIRVAWSLPDQDCFNFSSQTLSCSREGGPPLSTQSVDGSLLNGVVSDLSIDTLYNCTVKSVLTDSLRGSFDVMSVSAPVVTFTYPDCKFG